MIEYSKSCGKIVYPNPTLAVKAAKAIAKNRRLSGLRAYKCSTCKNWHLTSRGVTK